MILTLEPILYSINLEESINFYTHILGFAIVEKNDNWQWVRLSIDNIALMIAKPIGDQSVKNQFTGSFYFKCDNVDKWWEQLKDKVKIGYEIENFEWGMREFAFYDNNGYLLQIGAPI